MKKVNSQKDFKRIINALSIAAPLCLAARFENGFAHCIEMSMSGAAALRRRNIKAQALPCAIIGSKDDGYYIFSVGLLSKDMYKIITPNKSFEEWSQESNFPADDQFQAHMVIEARYGTERAIIDLTYGQLRQAHGLDVPMHMIDFNNKGWPQLMHSNWRLMYIDSPYKDKIIEETKKYTAKGLTDDMNSMIDVALYCDCDFEKFMYMIQSQQPEMFSISMNRLRKFMLLDKINHNQ